ncbi:MAG TPA: Na+/H+ antiporter NhaA [Streptosporangiaceae bacterium]|nr:Na+/H+ antiporter NhaA [Streptosporangiaceae bacterium]
MPDDGQLPVVQPFSGRTAWARNLQTPLRRFLRTETGSAAVLLAMAVAALVWVNTDVSSYEAVWRAQLSAELNGAGVALDLREWVNSGLMTFFFFVFGLEARREFDMGELRERRRLALPVLAGLGGLVLPVAIYLALNAGRPAADGWGAAMSTDSAFALGMLALTGPRFPDRVRVFLLSVAVVDDLVSLVVIGTVYTRALALAPLAAAIGIFAIILVLRRARIRHGIVYALLGIAAWVAVLKSGIDPVVVGLVMGLLTYAYPAARTDLERASDAFRSFREQPTPELARSASIGLNSALSPNDRLQQLYHPWTSYVIVPLFALANAGIVISGSFLARAYTSPVTLGILIGYVAGKPAGITAASWLLTRLSRGRLRPPVGWAAVTGVGSIMGIGFTVSILIATLAFSGIQLQEAKLGVLSTVVAAPLITWLVFRATTLLPRRLQIRAVLGTAETVTDLGAPVDPGRDHIRGPARAPVTLVEYGDFECPYCGQAEPVIRELLAGRGDVRYVWRHLPLNDVHPHAQLAAEASEAASDQGEFWPMHDLLLAHQGDLLMRDLVRYAGDLSLDTARFRDHLARRAGAPRVAEDVDSADLSGVSGTPTFFINGLRHYGAYDIGALSEAVQTAKARATIRKPQPPAPSAKIS